MHKEIFVTMDTKERALLTRGNFLQDAKTTYINGNLNILFQITKQAQTSFPLPILNIFPMNIEFRHYILNQMKGKLKSQQLVSTG